MRRLFFKLLLPTWCIAVLTACVSTVHHQSLDMQQYVGLPVSKLVKQLGSAEINYTDAQQTMLTYSPMVTEIPTATIETKVPLSSGGGPLGWGGYGVASTSAKTPESTRKVYADCQVHFKVKDDIVQSWAAQGSACPPALLPH